MPQHRARSRCADRLRRLLFCSCLLLTIGATPANPGAAAETIVPFVPGELLIGWLPETLALLSGGNGVPSGQEGADDAKRAASRTIAELSGLDVLDIHPAYGFALLSVEQGNEMTEVDRLADLPWVEYAELNYIAHAAGYPSDPQIGEQWNMRRVGAPAAWDVTLGSGAIIVAVVDSGIDRSHPEFAGRLVSGYDYVNMDNDPSDDFGHGTHVAGILAAAANNGAGISGLAPYVRILPIKVLDAQGGGAYNDIALGVRHATDAGARVINLSLGGNYDSATLRNAVAYASSRGALVVAAAGNCGQGGANCGGVNPDFFPAAYPDCIAVAATDHFDNWASFSGYKSYIDIAAPGGTVTDQVWSTKPGGYGFHHGTSMATPLVSATAALIWTLSPADTRTQVTDTLLQTADKVGAFAYSAGRNDYLGYGRLNVAHAVRWAQAPALDIDAPQLELRVSSARPRKQTSVALSNPSNQPVQWVASITQGGGWLTMEPTGGSASFSSPADLVLYGTGEGLEAGTHAATVQVRSYYPISTTSSISVTLVKDESLQTRAFLPLTPRALVPASWSDPVAAGAQVLDLADDSARELLLPFAVQLYDRSYGSMWVSDNGVVYFGTQPGGATRFSEGCLPSAALPNAAIYVLWENWRPDLGGQVYVHTLAEGGFVVSWMQMRRGVDDPPHSFQVIVRPPGQFLLQYRTLPLPMQGLVGAENYDGTVAQQILCSGEGQAPDGATAFMLTPELPW